MCSARSEATGDSTFQIPHSFQSAIGNPQSAIGNPQSAIGNPQSEIRNPQSEIRNPKSAIGKSAIRN
ncbi:MAG TPA: hypothetical protein VGQ81_12865 [Acidobacteriota bacterium]|nr:hypothetical protein [Acidobacteriota bacterium]